MTPKILFSVARKVDSNRVQLRNVGLTSFLALIALVITNSFFDYLIAITLAPLGILLIVFGLYIVLAWYKKSEHFERYSDWWNSISFFEKYIFYISSIFMTVWFLGIIVITFFIIIHTILFFISN